PHRRRRLNLYWTRHQTAHEAVLPHLLALTPRPPKATLFPYTTLFRSNSVSSRINSPIPNIPTLTKCSETRPRASFEHFVSVGMRSEEHTSELQSRFDLVCRLLLEKKKHA